MFYIFFSYTLVGISTWNMHHYAAKVLIGEEWYLYDGLKNPTLTNTSLELWETLYRPTYALYGIIYF